MPRADLSRHHVSMLMPLVAVHCCYSCMRSLVDDNDKFNCHCCYVGFCAKCTENRAVIREYGFTKPQRVCLVCHTLLTSFPRILSTVLMGTGGQLLMPKIRVWITDAKAFAPEDDAAAFSPGQRIGPGLAPTPASGVDAAVLAAAVNVGRNGKAALSATQGLELTLLAFRPLNPDTVLSLGDAARVPIRCISGVERDGARLRLLLVNGYIDITVAQIDGLDDEVEEYYEEDNSGFTTPGSTPEPTGFPAVDPSSPLPMDDVPSVGGSRDGQSSRSPHHTNSGSGTQQPQPTAEAAPQAPAKRSGVMAWLSNVFTSNKRQPGAKQEPEITITTDAEAATALEAGLRALLRRVKGHPHLRASSQLQDAAAAELARRLRPPRSPTR